MKYFGIWLQIYAPHSYSILLSPVLFFNKLAAPFYSLVFVTKCLFSLVLSIFLPKNLHCMNDIPHWNINNDIIINKTSYPQQPSYCLLHLLLQYYYSCSLQQLKPLLQERQHESAKYIYIFFCFWFFFSFIRI